MSNKLEVWKDISEFQGYYMVSNLGRVKRIASYSNQNTHWDCGEKILSPRKHSNGYLRVILSIDGKHYDRYIHRLVAKEFVVNKNESQYKEINHIDGDKTNNNATNLEWCDRSHNNKHAYKNGLHTVHGCYGKKKMVAKLDIETRQILDIFESVESAANSVDSLYANISAICSYNEDPTRYKRPIYKVKGFQWIFATDNMKIGDIVP